MIVRYPLCLYDKNGNWITVRSTEEEEKVSDTFKPFGYDWSIHKNKDETIIQDTVKTMELEQQNLFDIGIKESIVDHQDNDDHHKEDNTSVLLEDPIDRRNKRGRKPYKKD